jgi:hypothetical protein
MERGHAGLDMMTRILIATLLLAAGISRAANIDFRNLNTNHFTTNGYRVSLKSVPTNTTPSDHITNIVISLVGTGGITLAQVTNIASSKMTNGNMVYVDAVVGSDVLAQRWRFDWPAKTFIAAVNLSAAGDTVIGRPGNYTETNNILKAGVNYELLGGGTLISSTAGAQTNGIFDDRTISGGTINYINAPGWEFTRIMGTGQGEISSGVLVTSHTNTHIVFNFKKGWCQITDVTGDSRAGVLHILNAKYVSVHFKEIEEIGSGTLTSHCTPVYWELGEFYLEGDLIKSDASYCIWGSDPNGTKAANMWVNVTRMICPFSYAVWHQGTNANYKMWVSGKEIEAGYNTFLHTGGKLYVMYPGGKLGINERTVGAVVETFGGELWLVAGKMSQRDGNWLSVTNTIIHQFEVAHCDDWGTNNNLGLPGFALNGGTSNIRVGKALKRYGAGVMQRGGTNTVQIEMRTTANNVSTNWPVELRGGVLILRDPVLIAPPATTNAVYAATPQNLRVYGSGTFNTNVNPNVTVLSGEYTVNGYVQ